MRTYPSAEVIAFLILLPTAGCGAPQAGWKVHKDPGGYSVNLPPGWRASRDSASGRIEIRGSGAERLLVWPVFVAGNLDARSASAILRKLAPPLAPEVQWGLPQAAGPGPIRMPGRKAGGIALAALAWIPGPRGCAAFLYLAEAPEGLWRQNEETFAGVLGSLAFSGPSSEARAAPRLRYVRWHDPHENAFSLEAPEGWQIRGGLFRMASVDVRGAWQVVSPEGDIVITGGDAELPPFTEPTPMLAMTGFPEGSWYSPGYGVRMMVRRYMPGAAFAREYVVARAAPYCTDVVVTASRDLPDAVAAINAIYAQHQAFGVAMRLSAGEAAFTCRHRGRPARGYYFAGTQLTQVAGMQGGLWRAEYLAGFVASEEKLELAREVFDHILRSIEVNPQWMAMQQNLTASTSRIVSRTHAEISRIIENSYWKRQAVMDELSRRRSNAILSVEDVIDPATGRELKVESGSNYYWIDHRGAIVGTETHTRPSIDFREMIRLP